MVVHQQCVLRQFGLRMKAPGLRERLIDLRLLYAMIDDYEEANIFQRLA